MVSATASRTADPVYSKRRWTFSPLTFRILAVNVLALVILGGGILYLAKFEDNLIREELDTLAIEADIIAGAIGESATGGADSDGIDQAQAQAIIARLIGPTDNRGRLFHTDGRLLIDSRLTGPDGAVRSQPLPDLDAQPDTADRLENWFDWVLDTLSTKPDYPALTDRPGMTVFDLAEATTALTGESARTIRQDEDGTLHLFVAIPIQRFRKVLGVLLLSADTTQINAIVRAEQRLILTVFAGALMITLMMTLFLAGTIALPIRRLAQAAERVRQTIGQEEAFPVFPHRSDEIGDLSQSLAAMTQALYRQIGAVEAFAADVSHELKNPLSSLRSAVESLPLARDEAMQAKLLAIIQDDIKRLDRLITDISDASRVDADLMRSKAEKVDLAVLCRNIVEGYQALDTLGNRQIRLTQDSSKSFPVTGLDSRLSQIIRNLIDNALSFSPEGGTVALHLYRHATFLALTVDDEGPGLPKGAAEKIFQRFYSERPSEEAFGTHSGLGLSICKQIAEAHGGTITAENRLSDMGAILGARFILRLPKTPRG